VQKKTEFTNHPNANLLRRLMAILYDALVTIALLMLAAVPPVMLAGGSMPNTALRIAFQLYLIAVMFLFFGWFWVHGGQTLGMRAWRLRVVSADGTGIGWRAAGIRFLGAWLSVLALGLGYIWAIFDRERRTWHDRLSGTRVILLPKQK
jgi:uncharacterized RDD family membrane protein YckC